MAGNVKVSKSHCRIRIMVNKKHVEHFCYSYNFFLQKFVYLVMHEILIGNHDSNMYIAMFQN